MATLGPQTQGRRVPKMRGMEANLSQQEDIEENIKMNIKQFIEATRQYLFELSTAQAQSALATIPVRADR